MGKLTISMAIFNSYVSLPEGNDCMGLVQWDFNMFFFWVNEFLMALNDL